MSLKQQITEDMKTAMRARDTARLGAIRLLLSAMKQREVDERIELSDADVVNIIDKMIKQRRDSIAQFEAAARQELAEADPLVLRPIRLEPLKAQADDAAMVRGFVGLGIGEGRDAHQKAPPASMR